MTRKPAAAAAIAGFALMCSLAACAPRSAAPSQAAAEPGTLTVGLPGSLSTLDVAHETGIINYYVAQASSEGLLGVDAQGELVPAVASSHTTADGRTWVFQIRDDARFQDGNPVTIDDVLFSIDVARDPDRSPSSSVYWPAGTDVSQTGDSEITITLPAPAQNFGWTVTANGGLWITEKSYYEAAGAYGSAKDLIMGTGPYRAVEFQPDSKAVFVKSGTWWGGDTSAQKIEFDFFSDENSRLLAQRAGQIDVSVQIPADQVGQFEAIDGTTVHTESDRSYVGLTFDEAVEPFNDIHVRRAVAHAVDRASIVASVLSGRGEAATGIEPPDQLGSQIGEDAARALLATLPNTEFDLDKAREELAASHVPSGFEAELTYPASIPEMGNAALAIADNLKKIGVTLTVTSKPLEEWISQVGTGEYGLYYMSYTPTTGDAGEIPGWLLGEANPARYSNPEVASLIAQSNAQADPAARAQDLVSATAIAQENVIYSPIWWGKSTSAFSSRVAPKDFGPYFFMTPWTASLDLVQ